MRADLFNRVATVAGLWLAALVTVTLVAEEPLNLGEGRLALSGFDPVSYFEVDGPVKGRPSLEADTGKAVYRFASEENRQAFLEDPERYEPEYGGWCAWAMLEGDTVEVDPESFRVSDGKLLLFYDGFWGDTRSKWAKLAEKKGEGSLIEQANENWKALNVAGE